MDQVFGSELRAVREEFVAALVAGDANLAEIIALDAVSQGVAVADLYVEVVGPALTEIGHGWEVGVLTVADEHLATGIAHDVMRLVSRTATRYPRRSRERLLLAAVGGEAHITGLRMIGDLAEGHGFDVRYLGAAVPVGTFSSIVAKHEPEFVGLSVTIAGWGEDLERVLREIEASGHPPRGILVGGAAVPPALRADPRVHHAQDAREALEILERLADAV